MITKIESYLKKNLGGLHEVQIVLFKLKAHLMHEYTNFYAA